MAVIVGPLLCLGGVELGLRLSGFGYPASFFLNARHDGREVLIENPKFGWRFFPPPLARAPQPIMFPTEKSAGTCRIFILGESAAMGDPEPALGFSRVVLALLEARFPEKKFEIINAAMTAINSHVILPIARDCARRRGDIWVLYLGHNEVMGPFGPGTVFGAQSPNLSLLRATLALRATRIGQLLDATAQRLRGTESVRPSWRGMEMFLEKQIPPGDPRLERVYEQFQKNLRDILRAGTRTGAKMVVSTAASNLRDCAPFGSMHPANLGDAEKAQWEQLYRTGNGLEAAGKFPQALAVYQQAAKIDSQYAELQFRLGRCSLALGKYEAARRQLESARDLDTLRFRTDSHLNQTIRSVADNRASEGIYFADSTEDFARNSPQGITGSDFFFEHVHLQFEGNYLLARSVATQIDRILSTGGLELQRPDWLSLDDCARRLAATGWSRYRIVEAMRGRLNKPPFTRQMNHAEQDRRLQSDLVRLYPLTLPAAFDLQTQAYRQALAKAPDDWMLRDQFGQFLAAFGDTDGAAREWRKVIEKLPHYAAAHYELGRMLNRGNTRDEAVRWFTTALKLKPSFPEALNSLGIAFSHLGRFDDAYRQFARAVELRPDFVDAHVNWAMTLSNQRQAAEALVHYRAALRFDSNSLPAHINLAQLLIQQGKQPQATAHLREVLRLDPSNHVAQKYLKEIEPIRTREP